MKHGRMEDGFTLVESVASWTILLIALTIFLKCMNLAHMTMARGTVLQNQCLAAAESVEFGEEPLAAADTELKFRINERNLSMKATVMEYGMTKGAGGEMDPVTLKIIVPAAESEE